MIQMSILFHENSFFDKIKIEENFLKSSFHKIVYWSNFNRNIFPSAHFEGIN